MNDSEKPLKVVSAIVSALLVIAALLFLVFARGKPKEAQAELEYSAPPGFDTFELTSELDELRKDQEFLAEVAIRSGFGKASDPELGEMATRLGSRLTFEASLKQPAISIRFSHSKAATAMSVANTAATVAKERLELKQQNLTKAILCQEDAVEDKRKLLELVLKREANVAAGFQKEEKSWRCTIGFQSSIDAKADLEQAFRRVEELKAEPVFSIRAIRPAKLSDD
jgi:hypothetical protein